MEFNLKDVSNVLVDISDKYSGILKEAKCSDPRQLKKELLLNQNKEALAKWVLDLANVLARSQVVLRNVSGKFDEMKDTIISLQSTKIQNQEQLLQFKQQSIESFQSTIRSEMKSYRDVAFESIQPSVTVSHTNIEPAVKKVVQDEERSKNVILFGVKENDHEEVESVVSALFSRIGEKPNVSECLRLGKKSVDGPPRPIKVSLRSSQTAMQLRFNGRCLKDDPETRRVYISPDRSREERELRKGLVKEVKERMRSDSSKYHYISGTEVVSRERNPSSQAAPPVAVQKEAALVCAVKGSSKSDPFKDLLERSKSLSQRIANGT